jgi:hypothetical protein
MAQEVKIITFINDREGRETGEEQLTMLVNDGGKIKTAGGGQGAEIVWGFVILQREASEETSDEPTSETPAE